MEDSRSTSTAANSATSPMIIVSSDTHCGPRMNADLRAYCPPEHLDSFDEFVNDVTPVRDWWWEADAPNGRAAGHYDSAAREKDLDRDGIAAEVIFHFSFNGELIPFVPIFLSADKPSDLSLARVGMRIYNRWLADFCAASPGRRVGLAQIPIWDVDAAVHEVEWAAEAGLRGVNFPAQKDNLVAYDDPIYEPLWAACADANMPLTTHAGAASPASMINEAVVMMETGGVMNRRAIHRMIFAGIFERHPNLKLVMTEQPGVWQPALMTEMDSVYLAIAKNPSTGALMKQVNEGKNVAGTAVQSSKWNGASINTAKSVLPSKRPSDYFMSNVSIGASFLAHFEAEAAVREGFWPLIMWGSDYPHPEGCWKVPESDEEPSQVRLCLENTFHDIPLKELQGMAGLNAAKCYGLDQTHLADVARRIGAPSAKELMVGPERLPAGSGGTGRHAFRTMGAWF